MADVLVVTDGGADLPPDLAEAHAIPVVSLKVRFGEEEIEGADLSPVEFWRRCETSAQLPETAAPAPSAFEAVFRRAGAGRHTGVVCVTLSSELSATYQSACVAADAVADEVPVRVVDSRTATLGQGMIALRAAEAAETGASLDQVAELSTGLVRRTRLLGAIGNLEQLRKGGRIGGAAAFLGSLLSVKPIIEVRNGVVERESAQRTRRRSLEYLASKVAEQGPLERLAVAHAAAEDVDQLTALLASSFPVDDILVAAIGPVVGTHTGRGTVGVITQLRAD